MNPLIVPIIKLIIRKIKKRAKKSATIAVATGVGVSGIAAVIDPDLLGLIPEQYRGWVILGLSVIIAIARLRKEIAEGLNGVEADSE